METVRQKSKQRQRNEALAVIGVVLAALVANSFGFDVVKFLLSF